MDFVCQSTIEFGHEIIPKLYLSIASKPLKYLHDALWYVPSVTQLVQSGTEVPTYNAAIFTYPFISSLYLFWILHWIDSRCTLLISTWKNCNNQASKGWRGIFAMGVTASTFTHTKVNSANVQFLLTFLQPKVFQNQVELFRSSLHHLIATAILALFVSSYKLDHTR